MDDNEPRAMQRLVDDEQEVARQILVPKFLRQANGVDPSSCFPNAFVFKSREQLGNRRVESVVWLNVTTPQRTLAQGLDLAAKSRERALAKVPTTAEDELDQYEGYLAARVGDVRQTTPFDVFHEPENDQDEHCHLELMGHYVEFLREKAVRDRAVQDGDITAKNGRVLAINLLIEIFEGGGLYKQPHFGRVPLVAAT